MKWKKNTSLNKKGSYIVEAAIVVPLFIIAVLMLISLIPVIAQCENLTFEAADEMHFETAKTAFRKNAAAYPIALKLRTRSENDRLTAFNITGYRYLYSRNGIDDLITVKFSAAFSEKNPLGLFSTVRFKGKLTARAFTGTYYKDRPETKAEFEEDKPSEPVYIFPGWGVCYHGKNCTYVRTNCQLAFLSQELRRSYHPCPLCGASRAAIGTPVFCFLKDGEAYHMGGCTSINKYYIEIEKEQAVKKGYVPCSKCGGK